VLATALSIHLLKTGEGLLHACISSHNNLLYSNRKLEIICMMYIERKDKILPIVNSVMDTQYDVITGKLDKTVARVPPWRLVHSSVIPTLSSVFLKLNRY
jgi:hypothetical protein